MNKPANITRDKLDLLHLQLEKAIKKKTMLFVLDWKHKSL